MGRSSERDRKCSCEVVVSEPRQVLKSVGVNYEVMFRTTYLIVIGSLK